LPPGRRLGELGEMRSPRRGFPGCFDAPLLLVGLTLVASPEASGLEPIDVPAAVANARRAGLRVLESERLALATDRPPRHGDGVEDLPRLFDEAVATWCEHFGISVDSIAEWQTFGCLVVDRERFRQAGLLPPDIPPFTNGFCDRNRFWLMDQPNPAYRRHLLLHEGAHAFTLTVRGIATPVWHNEGVAEYLATHRLDEQGRFVSTPIPLRSADVEQLGRIEQIRELRAVHRAPSLADVLTAQPALHHDLAAYAASWAAFVMFAQHPMYADGFTIVERGSLGPDFNDRLAAMPGYSAHRAARDFDAFTDDIDYGYDFSRSAIDWSAGPALDSAAVVQVAAGRGWQNSGISLVKGRQYQLRARGRCMLGAIGDTTIETEPDGISLDWYRGRPLGRLLAAQWITAPADGGRPRFVICGEGATTSLKAEVDGPLYLKVNEPPADFGDDEGAFEVEVVAEP